jgi:serine/threonine-protein kinase
LAALIVVVMVIAAYTAINLVSQNGATPPATPATTGATVSVEALLPAATSAPVVVETLTPGATETTAPTDTPQPIPTSTRLTPSITPEPTAIAKALVLTLAEGVTMTLVNVPAGEFMMGSDTTKDSDALPDEQPQHRVYLSEYYIGQSEVTNAQFEVFAKATKRQWSVPAGRENHPVGGMGWFDAKAFADWLALTTGKMVRLPTEAEWEKACGGTDGRIYPWGDNWDASRLNSAEGGVNDTTPVDKYSPAGDSPYGAENMAGNVWEWVSDWYTDTAYLGLNATGTPLKDPTGPASGTVHVKRSGSFGNTRVYMRCAYRFRNHPFSGPRSNGFRMVVPAR